MNMTFLTDEAVRDLDSKGQLRAVLADLPYPIKMDKHSNDRNPVEELHIQRSGGTGRVFSQADDEDF